MTKSNIISNFVNSIYIARLINIQNGKTFYKMGWWQNTATDTI